jgi:hypothetical protein
MTLSALLYVVMAHLAAINSPTPAVDYVPLGGMAYGYDCLMSSATNGVLLYCQAENKIIIMATTEEDML